MSTYFEVPVRREDGTEGIHYVNIEAISCIDCVSEDHGDPDNSPLAVKVHLDNGYWFTLTGKQATDVLRIIKERTQFRFTGRNVEDN